MLETLRKLGFRTITFEVVPMLSCYAYDKPEYTDIIRKTGRWLNIFDGLYYIRDQQTN